MNDKEKAKSSGRALYLIVTLLAVTVMFITVYTIAAANLRRGPVSPVTEDGGTRAPGTRAPVTNAPDTRTPVTNAPDTRAPGTDKPSDTAPVGGDPSDPVDPGSIPVGGEPEYVLPVSGFVVKSHSMTVPVYSVSMNDYRIHAGIDIAAPVGSEVSVCLDGTVSAVYSDPFMGSCVTVDHGGGLQSCYKNLNAVLPPYVSVGAKLKGGDVIGLVGESAIIEIADDPHLHFELLKGGAQLDPLEYLPTFPSSAIPGNAYPTEE